MKQQKQYGFTLIELVVVIVILGILAVIAAPKFLNLQNNARHASLEGLKGSINGAIAIVFGKSAIDGQEQEENGSITVNGQTIATRYGYPTQESLSKAVNGLSGGDWAIIDGKQSQPLNLRRYGPFYGHHYQWLQFGWDSGNRPSYSCFYINDQGYPQGSPLWRNDFNSPDKCKNQDKKTIDQDRAKAEAKKKAEDAAKDKGSSIGGDSNENSLVITFNQYKGLTKAKIPNGCYITYVEAKDANTPAEVILSDDACLKQ